MTEKVTIQWCPSCQAWGKTKCVRVDVLEGLTEIDKLGLVAFNYRRENLRCNSCDGVYTRSSLKNRDPQHFWNFQGKVGDLHRTLDARESLTTAPEVAATAESHSEFSDYSAALIIH